MSYFRIRFPSPPGYRCSLRRGHHASAGLILLFTLLASVVLIHSVSTQALGAQITLAWDENTEPDVAGYRVHYGTFSGGYEHTLNAGTFTSCIVSGLAEGTTYYFAATAYDSQNNESSYSEEVSFTIPLPDSEDDADGGQDEFLDPVTPPGDTDTAPDDANDLAAASSESAGTDSSSTCFIGTCADQQGVLDLFARTFGKSSTSHPTPSR